MRLSRRNSGTAKICDRLAAKCLDALILVTSNATSGKTGGRTTQVVCEPGVLRGSDNHPFEHADRKWRILQNLGTAFECPLQNQGWDHYLID